VLDRNLLLVANYPIDPGFLARLISICIFWTVSNCTPDKPHFGGNDNVREQAHDDSSKERRGRISRLTSFAGDQFGSLRFQ
ncbi:hypothetical protein LAN33_26210, partial [Mycobacterium tuberculosis]|nr:hypothetical protein [Mycobacterium tuberculosis]